MRLAMTDFRPEEAFARALDADDPLAAYRERFHLPSGPDGRPLVYFAGHSLGLQPTEVRPLIEQELGDWARLGVRGHLHAARPWYAYHEQVRGAAAGLVGARPHEVVMMNGLTVNLHLMLVSFYRPQGHRYKVLMEVPAFPSDTYAVQTHLRHHGIEPADGLLTVAPRPGEHTVRMNDIETMLAEHGEQIAVVWIGAVNFLTGQRFDLPRIVEAARRHGCAVGFDLAHATGNVPLELHDWDVDFAVWCTYKYLNSGPGSIAGCFVHERHARNRELPRFGGWWGNDPATRFHMHLNRDFEPVPTADGWQISNPPVLAVTPLIASLRLFDETGMAALRRKSIRLTSYLEYLIDRIPGGRYEIITPRDPEARGCMLALLVRENAAGCQRALADAGVVCDFREPNIVRVAPVPLYNGFHEVWRFGEILAR